jgi:hypothetical protein
LPIELGAKDQVNDSNAHVVCKRMLAKKCSSQVIEHKAAYDHKDPAHLKRPFSFDGSAIG